MVIRGSFVGIRVYLLTYNFHVIAHIIIINIHVQFVSYPTYNFHVFIHVIVHVIIRYTQDPCFCQAGYTHSYLRHNHIAPPVDSIAQS